MTEAGLNKIADESDDGGAAGEDKNLIATAGQAVEEVAGESERCIRRYPVSAALAAFAGGALGGWLTGGLISRGYKRRASARVRRGPRGGGADKEAILKWEDEGGSVLSAGKRDGEK